MRSPHLVSAPFPRPIIAALLIVVATTACELLRGTDGTLARVRSGTIRVGVVENRPWTTLTPGGAAAGIEGALVAELARELGAKVEWVRATESQLLQALEMRELDLVIGGLTAGSPWARRVAFTEPFYTDTIVVGTPAGLPLLASLASRTVAVDARDPVTAAYVRRRGGVPQPVPDVGQVVGLVAAPTWQLPRLGFGSTGLTLREVHHVLAAPPRDTEWLRHVERSIAVRKAAIPIILRGPS